MFGFIQDDTKYPQKYCGLLAQHASSLHLPIRLERKQILYYTTTSFHPCALWTGDNIKPCYKISCLEGKADPKFIRSPVPISQLEFLEACTNHIERNFGRHTQKSASNTTIAIFDETRSFIKTMIFQSELDIAYFSPIYVPSSIQVYTFVSLEEVVSFIEPWKGMLQTLYVEANHFFSKAKEEKEMLEIQHLPLFQKLFSQTALMGLLHQRDL